LTKGCECCENDTLSSVCPEISLGIGFPGLTVHGKRPFIMNKVKLAAAVQKQFGGETTKAEAERAVTAVINAIKVGVKKDKVVQLVGFGTFKVVERKARKGVNPKTLQQIRIPKSKSIKFVPGKDFKSKV
jgi:nucleoid DNA-binding protein